MPHNYPRAKRVADLLKAEIAEMLFLEIKDPRIDGLVTVMEVTVTKDLRRATVSVSVMGSAKTTKSVMTGLNQAKGFIRSTLGRRIRMKKIPELHFELDRRFEQQEHIEDLLKKAAE